MTSADLEQFATIVAALSECYGQRLTGRQLELYYLALRDLTIEEVAAGVHWLINHRTVSSTMPLVAEIRQAIEYCKHNGLSVDDRAQLAWRKLVWAIERHGYYDSVQFDDPVIHQVVRAMGGWTRITGDNPDWTESQLQWRQRDFIALYRALAKLGTGNADHLPGLIELSNPGEQVEVHYIAGTPGQLTTTTKPAIAHTSPTPQLIDHLVNQLTDQYSGHETTK